eukprot:g39902.t1
MEKWEVVHFGRENKRAEYYLKGEKLWKAAAQRDFVELREFSIVPDDYTCGKCTQLQILGDCVRELELELDALRVIQDAERIIDKSFKEMVT